MNVGETLLITQELSYINAIGTCVVPATPTATVTAPDGTVTTPTVTAHAGASVQLPYMLALRLTPTQGGSYSIQWQYLDSDGEIIIQFTNRFAWWTNPCDIVRRRLVRSDLLDQFLEPEFSLICAKLLARFPVIGTDPAEMPAVGIYNGLTGDDRVAFDEAVALLLCSRMIGPLTTGGQASDLTGQDEGDVKSRFSDTGNAPVPMGSPGDMGSGPGGYSGASERQRWIREAAESITRISSIKAARQAASLNFSPFAISGPSRTDAANGRYPTLFSNVYQLLTDDMTAFDGGFNGSTF